MKRCLVTGGTGFVGSHLVDALLASGQAVTCTVRSTSDPHWIKGTGAQLAPCRLDDPADLARALIGASTVYHLAGAIAARNAEEFMQINAGLTRSLLDACSRLEPPPRFVYVSSLAAAGPSKKGQARTESMPPRPVSDYGRSKLAAEEAVHEYAGRLPATIIRPPVVFGPRDPAMLSVFKLARSPLRPGVGSDRELSLVYVRDLVQGIVLAADSDAAVGQTYFLAHPETLTTRQLGDVLAEVLGGRGITVPVPDRLVKAAAAVGETLVRPFGRTPTLSRDKARELTQSAWVCSPEKARTEIGFVASTPHRDALAATAAWYQAVGWL